MSGSGTQRARKHLLLLFLQLRGVLEGPWAQWCIVGIVLPGSLLELVLGVSFLQGINVPQA